MLYFKYLILMNKINSLKYETKVFYNKLKLKNKYKKAGI